MKIIGNSKQQLTPPIFSITTNEFRSLSHFIDLPFDSGLNERQCSCGAIPGVFFLSHLWARGRFDGLLCDPREVTISDCDQTNP
jgi:hypothetical protein